MSETWHTERMYILTENGTFLAQVFSLEDAGAIVREHNAHGVMLDACKTALPVIENAMATIYGEWSSLPPEYEAAAKQVRDAIALAEGGEK